MDYLSSQGLDPEDCLGFTEEVKKQTESIARGIYAQFALHLPTERDINCVFTNICVSTSSEGRSDNKWQIEISRDRTDLLIYAFDAAAKNGKPGNWNYIAGVLKNLAARGIRTLEQARTNDDL